MAKRIPPLTDEGVYAIEPLADQHSPVSHDQLKRIISGVGLSAADPGINAGKVKRIRAVMHHALANDRVGGAKLASRLIGAARGHGGFRRDRTTFVGDEAFENLRDAYRARTRFPVTFKPDVPDPIRVAAQLLARCATTGEACLHLAELGRRTDLMATVRTLFEHVVMLAWLLGDGEKVGDRMLLWERDGDRAAIRMDEDAVRLGERTRLSDEVRHQMTKAAEVTVDPMTMPNLADRAMRVDREWADRLGLDPHHRHLVSMRKTYTSIYRVGSAMAHPSLPGVSLNKSASPSGATIDLEPAGRAHEALRPVPMLLFTAYAVSAHVLGQPSLEVLDRYLDWYIETTA